VNQTDFSIRVLAGDDIVPLKNLIKNNLDSFFTFFKEEALLLWINKSSEALQKKAEKEMKNDEEVKNITKHLFHLYPMILNVDN
jgi:hypothetical protein